MRLGGALPITAPDGTPQPPRGFALAAEQLEALGFDSIWVFDAVGRGFMLPDPITVLGVAATVTSTVELGTGVLQLANRGTVDLAYRALTLHHLCEGRLLLGIGPGSTEADFLALGASYADRFRRFDEELPRLRRLLAEGRDGATDLTPWPSLAGGPSVLYAGWRGRWVERAAREADGWIASAAHNDDATLADAIARYRASGGRRAIVTNVQVGRDPSPSIERLHRLGAMGFDDAVVLVSRPTEDRLQALRDALPAMSPSNPSLKEQP